MHEVIDRDVGDRKRDRGLDLTRPAREVDDSYGGEPQRHRVRDGERSDHSDQGLQPARGEDQDGDKCQVIETTENVLEPESHKTGEGASSRRIGTAAWRLSIEHQRARSRPAPNDRRHVVVRRARVEEQRDLNEQLGDRRRGFVGELNVDPVPEASPLQRAERPLVFRGRARSNPCRGEPRPPREIARRSDG